MGVCWVVAIAVAKRAVVSRRISMEVNMTGNDNWWRLLRCE